LKKEAALAYDRKAIELFKKFARPNIISNPYAIDGGMDDIEIPNINAIRSL